MSILFFVNAVLFGIGLAMDAFSVSVANSLNDPQMKKSKMVKIAGVFAFFQIAMPLIGWICVHSLANIFNSLQKIIPWIALILLTCIGGKMVIDGFKNNGDESVENCKIGFWALILQGIATSIDALSVGFTIEEYAFYEALIECLIIGIVTFGICMGGLIIGKKIGEKLNGKASILGGVILIAIAVEIFVTKVVLV